MTISSDFDAVGSGVQSAKGDLPTGNGGQANAPGVDPRLSNAVDDTHEEGKKGRDRVGDRTDKAGKFNKGLEDIDKKGDRNVSGIGGSNSGKSGMPTMPTVPQAGGQPQAAASPAPSTSPASSGGGFTPPSGITTIDPGLLQKLVEMSNAQAAQEAGDGMSPELAGDPYSNNSAKTPQNPDGLDVSQVSLEKYPGGPLSKDAAAAVIDQALTINGVPNDPNIRAQWQELYQHMAQGESSYNPNAANNDDTNATGLMMEDGAHANSSRGMWQTIPSTFASYHMGGTSNSIYDPVASAAASMNYVMHRYHVSPDGANLASFASGRGVGTGGYTGY